MRKSATLASILLVILLCVAAIQYNAKTGRSHNMIIASATLDFPMATTTGCDELTISAPGADLNDPVFPGVPNMAMSANSDFSAFVSAADVVTVKHCAHGLAVNPVSGTFKVVVFKE